MNATLDFCPRAFTKKREISRTPVLFPFFQADSRVIALGHQLLRYTEGIPRLTQRSVTFPWEGPQSSVVLERVIFYIRHQPHYANYAGYWVCTITTHTILV